MVCGRAKSLPERLVLAAEQVQSLRYGENPHQEAALYRWVNEPPAYEQLQGKELSFNNIVDLEAAWAMPQEFSEPAVAIIKHTNPSGLAVAGSLVEAYRLAYECDPVSAFGGIIACNRPVDLAFVEAVGGLFVEVLAAPAYSEEALAWLAEHKKNCRVMRAQKRRSRQARLAASTRRAARADSGRARRGRVDLGGGHEARADGNRALGSRLCLDRREAHEVERDRAGTGHRHRRSGGGPDESCRFGAPGRPPRGRPGTRGDPWIRCFLPICRWGGGRG